MNFLTRNAAVNAHHGDFSISKIIHQMTLHCVRSIDLWRMPHSRRKEDENLQVANFIVSHPPPTLSHTHVLWKFQSDTFLICHGAPLMRDPFRRYSSFFGIYGVSPHCATQYRFMFIEKYFSFLSPLSLSSLLVCW